MNERSKEIADKVRRDARWLRAFAFVLVLTAVGCAGGMPSVPTSPDEILAKGDDYFRRHRYIGAQELFKAFLQRHPGHDRSDYAQFMLAESYYYDRDYALAAVEYRILVSNYGYSDYVDDGYLKEALCLYHQGRKPELDPTESLQALEKLGTFVQVFSQSPLLPEAQDHVEKIKAKLAKKDFDNAMFYYKKKQFLSAIIYFDKIIENYDGNDWSTRAKYYKALVMRDREEYDEAIMLFSEVVNYPGDVEVKSRAERELRKLREERELNQNANKQP